MNTNLVLTAITLAAISFFLAVNLNRLFKPPSIPGSRDVLSASEIIHVTGASGPESLAFDPNEEGPYTGVGDGRILKWKGDGSGWTDFAVTSSERRECVRAFAPEMEHVCGRPLGLRFEKKTGHLYIADAYLGLQVVGPNGGLATPLLTEVEGRRLLFTNDLDIDEVEDAIYFTDSSTIFQRRRFPALVLSGDATGRLLKYDKSSKEVTVLLRGLAFANGVALSKDRTFVLVAESTAGKITRYWLKGPNAGKSDLFAILPGHPDNIRRNSNGEFWVALASKLGPVSYFTSDSWVWKTLLKLPLSYEQMHKLSALVAHATAVKLSEEGHVLEVLEDCHGKGLRFISEVEEENGRLWFGSVKTNFIGVYNLH